MQRAEVIVTILQPNTAAVAATTASAYISTIRSDLSFSVKADSPDAAKREAIATFNKEHGDRFFIRAAYPQTNDKVLLIAMQGKYLTKPAGIGNRRTIAQAAAKR